MTDALIQIDPKAIPRVEQRILCATLLEAVLRFYEHPENQTAFEQWHTEKGGTKHGR